MYTLICIYQFYYFDQALISPTYDFHGTGWNRNIPGSQTWMSEIDARAQQANVPTVSARPYPSRFRNEEGLPLTTPGSATRLYGSREWQHYPFIPGQTTTWTPGSGPPGAVRSVYTAGNPMDFDVIYHYEQSGTSAEGHSTFSMATYHTPTSQP